MVFLTMIIMTANFDVMCGELRDYSLPSQKQQLNIPVRTYEKIPTELMYDNFEGDVKNLTNEERDELIKRYKKRCGEERSPAAQAHYKRLILILERCNK
jgi:hypothetical protein